MIWASVIFLAVVVSLDSLIIGITYGTNQITISARARFVLSLISACTVFGAMQVGLLLGRHLSTRCTDRLGGIIFALLGLYSLWRNRQTPETERTLLDLRIPFLGLIIRVFQEPLAADYDCSQHISIQEAFVLGGALAFDAIAAGFGGAVLGLPVFPTTLSVLAASFFFISLGLRTGKRMAAGPAKKHWLRWLPGSVVFCLGLLRILF